ncbi:hypothetical protein [Marinilabilia salmonicolor]|uniref:hypothetical protein n=1 Tax=Marinilabilia salmonicolor TaxID=989 RepID=UPI00029B2590|nr:hypothetical protein [Marinilabilia salmonicolor]
MFLDKIFATPINNVFNDGRQEAILNEFKDASKMKLMQVKLYIALYALVSLIFAIGLPWLHNELNDHFG